MTAGHKQPVSVLVVIHTAALDVLLLERSAHPGFWQSVTGSREGSESLINTARREVLEETGIDTASGQLVDWKLTNTFEIFDEWRHRYAPGVTHNTEHVFSLRLANRPEAVTTTPDEHRDWQWLPWTEAAERCFSWTNRDAILMLKKIPFSGT
ncbi:MAG: dihydroneopterin triphosphate diphosphatase [Dechloromonas sp.]|nr:dihydroneopterin triphosphate diphosphatase [Dechloromonas sp.]